MCLRWAAKEAAIKAHRHRKLYYRDISILPPTDRILDQNPKPEQKPSVLIQPVPQYVVMETRVAISRGLAGFSSDKPDGYTRPGSSETISGEILDGHFVPGTGPNTRMFVSRKRLVKEEERQVAELSISHDGPYVVAVCMALDEEVKDSGSLGYVIDDGSGDPMHEPEWSDRGWLHEPFRRWKLGLDRRSQPLESPLGQMLDSLGL